MKTNSYSNGEYKDQTTSTNIKAVEMQFTSKMWKKKNEKYAKIYLISKAKHALGVKNISLAPRRPEQNKLVHKEKQNPLFQQYFHVFTQPINYLIFQSDDPLLAHVVNIFLSWTWKSLNKHFLHHKQSHSKLPISRLRVIVRNRADPIYINTSQEQVDFLFLVKCAFLLKPHVHCISRFWYWGKKCWERTVAKFSCPLKVDHNYVAYKFKTKNRPLSILFCVHVMTEAKDETNKRKYFIFAAPAYLPSSTSKCIKCKVAKINCIGPRTLLKNKN